MSSQSKSPHFPMMNQVKLIATKFIALNNFWCYVSEIKSFTSKSVVCCYSFLKALSLFLHCQLPPHQKFVTANGENHSEKIAQKMWQLLFNWSKKLARRSHEIKTSASCNLWQNFIHFYLFFHRWSWTSIINLACNVEKMWWNIWPVEEVSEF